MNEQTFIAHLTYDQDEDGNPAFVETTSWSRVKNKQIAKCVLPNRTLLQSKVDFSKDSMFKTELNKARDEVFKDILDVKSEELSESPGGATSAELKKPILVRDFSELHGRIVIPLEIVLIMDCDESLWEPDQNGYIQAFTHENTVVESVTNPGPKIAIRGQSYKIWPDVEIGKLKETTKRHRGVLFPRKKKSLSTLRDAYQKALIEVKKVENE